MITLSLDTSTESCSAALLYNNEHVVRYQVAPRQHSRLILPMIDELFAEAQLALSQLDFIAFACGPGAFTGVRLAAAVTQGIAYAHDLPVVAVSSLAALAQGLHREQQAAHCLAAIDARMQEVYWGFYSVDEAGHMQPQCEEQVCQPSAMLLENISQHLSLDWQGAGSGFDQYAQEIEAISKKYSINRLVWSPGRLPHALDIAILAQAKYLNGEVLSAKQALPHYVRNQVVQKA